jgi:hypothetical protein
MPSREEEFSAGQREGRGKPLCPFCGREYVYPVRKGWWIFKRTLGWSCANEDCRWYRKLFPSPSRGSGNRRR